MCNSSLQNNAIMLLSIYDIPKPVSYCKGSWKGLGTRAKRKCSVWPIFSLRSLAKELLYVLVNLSWTVASVWCSGNRMMMQEKILSRQESSIKMSTVLNGYLTPAGISIGLCAISNAKSKGYLIWGNICFLFWFPNKLWSNKNDQLNY